MPDNTNSENHVSRRGLFHVLASVPAVAAVTATSALAQDEHAQMAHPQPASASKGPYQRKTFLDDQLWKTVHVLCDLVIPADDRSGSATQAGVPEFIDDWIDFRLNEFNETDLQARILGGLMWLERESLALSQKHFTDASADQQKQLLDRIAWPERAQKEDAAWVEFFDRFRDLTVTGFYSSKMGVADLQYKGNTAVVKFIGCPPDVWAIIEQRMKSGYKGVAIQEVKPLSS